MANESRFFSPFLLDDALFFPAGLTLDENLDQRSSIINPTEELTGKSESTSMFDEQQDKVDDELQYQSPTHQRRLPLPKNLTFEQNINNLERESPLIQSELLTAEHELSVLRSRVAVNEEMTAVTGTLLETLKDRFESRGKVDSATSPLDIFKANRSQQSLAVQTSPMVETTPDLPQSVEIHYDAQLPRSPLLVVKAKNTFWIAQPIGSNEAQSHLNSFSSPVMRRATLKLPQTFDQAFLTDSDTEDEPLLSEPTFVQSKLTEENLHELETSKPTAEEMNWSTEVLAPSTTTEEPETHESRPASLDVTTPPTLPEKSDQSEISPENERVLPERTEQLLEMKTVRSPSLLTFEDQCDQFDEKIDELYSIIDYSKHRPLTSTNIDDIQRKIRDLKAIMSDIRMNKQDELRIEYELDELQNLTHQINQQDDYSLIELFEQNVNELRRLIHDIKANQGRRATTPLTTAMTSDWSPEQMAEYFHRSPDGQLLSSQLPPSPRPHLIPEEPCVTRDVFFEGDTSSLQQERRRSSVSARLIPEDAQVTAENFYEGDVHRSLYPEEQPVAHAAPLIPESPRVSSDVFYEGDAQRSLFVRSPSETEVEQQPESIENLREIMGDLMLAASWSKKPVLQEEEIVAESFITTEERHPTSSLFEIVHEIENFPLSSSPVVSSPVMTLEERDTISPFSTQSPIVIHRNIITRQETERWPQEDSFVVEESTTSEDRSAVNTSELERVASDIRQQAADWTNSSNQRKEIYGEQYRPEKNFGEERDENEPVHIERTWSTDKIVEPSTITEEEEQPLRSTLESQSITLKSPVHDRSIHADEPLPLVSDVQREGDVSEEPEFRTSTPAVLDKSPAVADEHDEHSVGSSGPSFAEEHYQEEKRSTEQLALESTHSSEQERYEHSSMASSRYEGEDDFPLHQKAASQELHLESSVPEQRQEVLSTSEHEDEELFKHSPVLELLSARLTPHEQQTTDVETARRSFDELHVDEKEIQHRDEAFESKSTQVTATVHSPVEEARRSLDVSQRSEEQHEEEEKVLATSQSSTKETRDEAISSIPHSPVRDVPRSLNVSQRSEEREHDEEEDVLATSQSSTKETHEEEIHDRTPSPVQRHEESFETKPTTTVRSLDVSQQSDEQEDVLSTSETSIKEIHEEELHRRSSSPRDEEQPASRFEHYADKDILATSLASTKETRDEEISSIPHSPVREVPHSLDVSQHSEEQPDEEEEEVLATSQSSTKETRDEEISSIPPSPVRDVSRSLDVSQRSEEQEDEDVLATSQTSTKEHHEEEEGFRPELTPTAVTVHSPVQDIPRSLDVSHHSEEHEDELATSISSEHDRRESPVVESVPTSFQRHDQEPIESPMRAVHHSLVASETEESQVEEEEQRPTQITATVHSPAEEVHRSLDSSLRSEEQQHEDERHEEVLATSQSSAEETHEEKYEPKPTPIAAVVHSPVEEAHRSLNESQRSDEHEVEPEVEKSSKLERTGSEGSLQEDFLATSQSSERDERTAHSPTASAHDEEDYRPRPIPTTVVVHSPVEEASGSLDVSERSEEQEDVLATFQSSKKSVVSEHDEDRAEDVSRSLNESQQSEESYHREPEVSTIRESEHHEKEDVLETSRTSDQSPVVEEKDHDVLSTSQASAHEQEEREVKHIPAVLAQPYPIPTQIPIDETVIEASRSTPEEKVGNLTKLMSQFIQPRTETHDDEIALETSGRSELVETPEEKVENIAAIMTQLIQKRDERPAETIVSETDEEEGEKVENITSIMTKMLQTREQPPVEKSIVEAGKKLAATPSGVASSSESEEEEEHDGDHTLSTIPEQDVIEEERSKEEFVLETSSTSEKDQSQTSPTSESKSFVEREEQVEPRVTSTKAFVHSEGESEHEEDEIEEIPSIMTQSQHAEEHRYGDAMMSTSDFQSNDEQNNRTTFEPIQSLDIDVQHPVQSTIEATPVSHDDEHPHRVEHQLSRDYIVAKGEEEEQYSETVETEQESMADRSQLSGDEKEEGYHLEREPTFEKAEPEKTEETKITITEPSDQAKDKYGIVKFIVASAATSSEDDESLQHLVAESQLAQTAEQEPSSSTQFAESEQSDKHQTEDEHEDKEHVERKVSVGSEHEDERGVPLQTSQSYHSEEQPVTDVSLLEMSQASERDIRHPAPAGQFQQESRHDRLLERQSTEEDIALQSPLFRNDDEDRQTPRSSPFKLITTTISTRTRGTFTSIPITCS